MLAKIAKINFFLPSFPFMLSAGAVLTYNKDCRKIHVNRLFMLLMQEMQDVASTSHSQSVSDDVTVVNGRPIKRRKTKQTGN